MLSAKNLPNVDKTGACAAFCEFEWRGFKGKTSVKAHSCSPRWEETFAFFFDDVTSLADLLIVVKDWRADGQVCDEKQIGQVLIPAESLQTFLQQDQVAHEEGSFAVLDQHGKEIVGQDNEPCVIDLKMRVLGHGEAHASNVEVPHRTGTAAETEGSKWEAFDKLTADLSAAERQVAEHQLEKEKTARELTESLALLHALVAAVCRDERLLPDAASKVGGVGLALVQKAEGSGSKAVGDKALLDKRSFLKISAIAAGGPADMDGSLGVGARVVAVDDQDVSALDAKAVGLLLKGPVGTSVKIKALKDDTSDARPYEVSLRREELHSGGADFAEANTPRRLDFAAVEIGKRGCQVAASMHTELDQLRARLSSAESALAEAKEELNQKSMEAAAAASTADSSHKDSAALESATALAKKLSDALKSEKTAVSALEKDKLMLSQELTRAQVELQQLQQDLDAQRRDAAAAALAGAAAADEGAACIAELKLEAQAAEDKIKAVLLQKEEVDSELQDCRRKQADQALDLEEATMAVKAMHSIICKQGPAAAQGGIGVALGSEMVRVKGSPIKMYKVAQLASSGPAAASGAIQAGDYILEVDGRKLAGMHSKDVKLLIRGPSGTSITLKAQ
ncbi:MAG: PDZ domain-containing protein, partial [Promethearchaeia archaeon]